MTVAANGLNQTLTVQLAERETQLSVVQAVGIRLSWTNPRSCTGQRTSLVAGGWMLRSTSVFEGLSWLSTVRHTCQYLSWFCLHPSAWLPSEVMRQGTVWLKEWSQDSVSHMSWKSLRHGKDVGMFWPRCIQDGWTLVKLNCSDDCWTCY